tara:strand:- start:6 stop:683 length:678 start_codon:yes stop_codon:yes gene_type:complete
MKFDVNKLKKEQLRLAKKIIVKDSFEDIKLVGGCDQAFIDNKIISMVVVFDMDGKIIEKKHAVIDASIPFIPGFLAYREMPAILEAFNKLENKPDILMCDCNGILHPRKIGMASHVGLILEIPTIGIAKRKLIGIVDGNNKIMHEDQVLGMEVETKEHAKPVFVSPGHMVSMKTSVKFVKDWLKGHKTPEPLHVAHKFANGVKKKLKEERETENIETIDKQETKS